MKVFYTSLYELLVYDFEVSHGCEERLICVRFGNTPRINRSSPRYSYHVVRVLNAFLQSENIRFDCAYFKQMILEHMFHVLVAPQQLLWEGITTNNSTRQYRSIHYVFYATHQVKHS